MKNLLASFLFLLASLSTFAQIDSAIYQAYLAADATQYSEVFNKFSESDNNLKLAKTQYAAVGAYQKTGNTEGAQKMLDQAETLTKAYLKSNSKSAEANALLSGIYGMQIGLSPMKGMTLGAKSSNLLEKALKNDPDNAFANYQKGSSLYYTPRIWGGNVPKAIEHLHKAKALYEAAGVNNNWEYLAVLAILGQAYHYQEELKAAETIYQLALQTAPEFSWVKRQLLPALEKDME